MKISKKILGLIFAGVLSMSLVACSTETEKVDSDAGSAAPVEEKKEDVKEAETEKEDLVLIDDDLVKVTVTEKIVDAFGAGYNVTVENKSDKKLIVQTRDTSISGVMEEPIFSPEVMPGKTSKDMMQFMNITKLEELKNLEGKIVVIDENYNDLQSYDMNIE